MKTLKSSFKIAGAGLMSGIPFEVNVKPSDKKGVYFTCKDKVTKGAVENIVSADHCVVTANVNEGADFRVALIEHFMAACAIAGLDGVVMEFTPFDGAPMYEVPILDGSSKVWIEEFKKAGFTGDEDGVSKINAPVLFQKDRSAVIILPPENSDSKTKISYAVNFNHPELKMRWASLDIDKNLDEIIEARTFGYLKDLETFQKMGLSKGVTIENTVGMTEDGYTTTLRSEFEPVKHKILDIIGDLYLTGVNPLKTGANIIVKEAGHSLHIEAAKILKKSMTADCQ